MSERRQFTCSAHTLTWVLGLVLVACAAHDQSAPIAPTASPALPPTQTITPMLTPISTTLPTITPTRRPTITPPPSERDDHPAKLLSVALPPGGFLSWNGSVEVFVDEQDWMAIFLPPGPDADVTFELEMQCGGGDTARVGLFRAGVIEGIDSDGDGRLSYEEALESDAVVADFEMGCLQKVSATVLGGADYYLVVYMDYGGQTGYTLYASR